MEALVIGTTATSFFALPHLLSRAGFEVDVVTTSVLMRLSHYARTVYTQTTSRKVAAFAEKLAASRARPYDWVIVVDDSILGDVVAWEQRTGQQSRILPLQCGRSRRHLYSKIGLSQTLAEAGIRTPAFRAAANITEACTAANAIGYPVFVKRDASCGGYGVFECQDEAALVALRDAWGKPVLVQKKIDGAELDLSAIFLDNALVHFSYSIFERTMCRFGPSSLRRYYPLRLVDQSVYAELTALGRTLGAHGFCNITAIDASDGSGRYYIEADMRPNVWADYSVYLGEDPALRIRNWFSHSMVLTKENADASSPQQAIQTIPYFLRFNIFELLGNRDHVWSYIPRVDAPLIWTLLFLAPLRAAFCAARRCIPKSWKRALRQKFAA